jgi:two-component system phosphate regulon sensor histidine kinase PhoR
VSGTEIALALLVALLAAVLWRERREFMKLRRWAAQRRLNDPPEAAGAWGAVFNFLHRHRRENLRHRRQLARLIVRSRRAAEALPYGVTVLNARMRIEWCNHAAREHLGIDPERDRGEPIANFVRQPDFAEYLAAGEFSQPLRLKASEALALSIQYVPFEEEAWLFLTQDVTGAERIDAMRRDFVANVSHELKTPLTVLSGFIETIQDLKLDGERVRNYIGLMAPPAERMRRLIEDLLTLSALEHAPPPPEQRIAVRPLLERLRAEAAQLSAGRHRISVEIEGEHYLSGAESEIWSAFLNLVTNAVRYTPAGGEIRIGWRAGAHGAEYSVQDSGIGIEAEHLPRLTERFYRVDRGRSSETGGTGLGLAIVKHALTRHQATLAIESTPGKGSVFRARFPASRLLAADQKVPG